MKLSEAEVRKWAQLYSDEIVHFSPEEFEYVVRLAMGMDAELLPDDAGVIGYLCVKDFDCKKRMSVLILYCRPEKRGRYLRYMLRRLEEIAAQEGAVELAIGHSISGYKENKFNRMLQYFGYAPCVYSKRF